jgi:hypothetical protein
MDSQKGRSQTTVGIWATVSNGPDNTTNNDNNNNNNNTSSDSLPALVLDVEGLDSRERNGECAILERQMSLLSLIASRVLLINMWTTDVGRFDGANYPILRTIFEVYLEFILPSEQPAAATDAAADKNRPTARPPQLLFVLRDFPGQPGDEEYTDLDTLALSIREDLLTLWTSIHKPQQYHQTEWMDFFKVDFVSLPSRLYEPDLFKIQVGRLKRRLLDPQYDVESNTTTIPSTAAPAFENGAFQTDLPFHDWPLYVHNIWSRIQKSEQLDLPTQREMLAVFRCDQILCALYETFEAEMETVESFLRNVGTEMGFLGARIHDSVQKSLTAFDLQTRHYNVPQLVLEKRANLLIKFAERAQISIQLQLRIIQSDMTHSARKAFAAIPKQVSLTQFSKDLASLRGRFLMMLRKKFSACAVAALADAPRWNFHQRLQPLRLALNECENETKWQRFQWIKAQLMAQCESGLFTWLHKWFCAEKSPNIASRDLTELAIPSAYLGRVRTAIAGESTLGVTTSWLRIIRHWKYVNAKMLKSLMKLLRALNFSETQLMAQLGRVMDGEMNDILEGVFYKLAKQIQPLMEGQFRKYFVTGRSYARRQWMAMESQFRWHFASDGRNYMRPQWTAEENLDYELNVACHLALGLLDQISIIRIHAPLLKASWFQTSDHVVDWRDEFPKVDIKAVVLDVSECATIMDAFRVTANEEAIKARAVLKKSRSTLLWSIVPISTLYLLGGMPWSFIFALVLLLGAVVLFLFQPPALRSWWHRQISPVLFPLIPLAKSLKSD